MSVNEAAPVGMKSYKELLTVLSPETVLCVRGRHAVGKSEGVYQSAAERRSDFYKSQENCVRMMKALADPTHGLVRHASGWVSEWNYDMGMPVVERRLSQMTEGDMIGLPRETQVDGQDCTQFRPCDWIIQACHFPVVLFLDERNRALDGVKQSVFQIADSKAFYGNRLNPETQVVVAENIGEAYQVQQNDPAETSRWVTIQLEPSFTEFIAYAKDRVDPAVIEFLRGSPKSLEYTGVYEPNKKYPDRRSWIKFAQEAQSLGFFEDDNPGLLLRTLANGYLGMDVGPQFYTFIRDRERQVKATDVLKDWKKAKQRLAKHGKLSNEKFVEIVQKIGDYFTGVGTNKKPHILTPEEADQFAYFMWDCPAEPRMACWTLLQNDTENQFRVHQYVQHLMVRTATGDDVESIRPDKYKDDIALPDFSAVSSEDTTETEKPKSGRGRKKA